MELSETLKKAWSETDKPQFIAIIRDSKSENLNELLMPNQKEIWKTAFDSQQIKSKVLICADERVMPLSGEFKIGTAGQLILDSPEYRDNFVSNFKGKVKSVRSHSGCGAAGIAYSKLDEEEKQKFIVLANELSLKGLPLDEISQGDLYGACHSYNLAKSLGADFEHTPFSEMRGYRDFHDARIIFWSADPTFDPSGLTGSFLPPHFLSNGLAFGLNEGYCAEELKVLSGIALGEHGFGRLFNADNPFYVVSMGKDESEAKKLNELAKDTMKEFGDRVECKYILTITKG